jgi:hypothetical protein
LHIELIDYVSEELLQITSRACEARNLLKIPISRDTTPCSLLKIKDVSEEHVTSIIKVKVRNQREFR